MDWALRVLLQEKKKKYLIMAAFFLDNSSKKNYGLGFKGSPSRKKKEIFNNGGLLCHCRSKEGHFNFGPKWITRKIPLWVHATIIMQARIDRDDHGRSSAEWNTLKSTTWSWWHKFGCPSWPLTTDRARLLSFFIYIWLQIK